MAKCIGPCFSLDARGVLGGALVYSIRRGVNYVRQLDKPPDPNTPKQQAIRATFQDGISKWRFAFDLITPADRVTWNYYALGTAESGFNRFMRYYLKANYDSATGEKTVPQTIPAPT